MLIAEPLRAYILETFLFTDKAPSLNNDDSLMAKGIIDSTGILELVSFIQDTFHVRIEDHEMVPENLDSIDKIVAFVTQKTGNQ